MREIHSAAANYSKHDWRVFLQDGEVRARLAEEASEQNAPRPTFEPKTEMFQRPFALAPVQDGWLVAFNLGEFGAALHWFNHDGTANYRISRHQVVDFFKIKDDLYAIEGLAHMSRSRGSIIRIAHSKETKTWQATLVVTLPYAPEAVSVTRAGLILVTLSESLVAVDSQWTIKTILPNAPWQLLYPTSSVLARDEKKLYIGMRQFVGEFNLASKKLRLLIPSDEFLNKLSPADIEQICKLYGP